MPYAIEYQRDQDVDLTRIGGLTRQQAETRARYISAKHSNEMLLVYVLCGIPTAIGQKVYCAGCVDHIDGEYH